MTTTTLTDRQLDGLACVECGEEYAPMQPIAHGPRGQLFRCSTHTDEPSR